MHLALGPRSYAVRVQPSIGAFCATRYATVLRSCGLLGLGLLLLRLKRCLSRYLRGRAGNFRQSRLIRIQPSLRQHSTPGRNVKHSVLNVAVPRLLPRRIQITELVGLSEVNVTTKMDDGVIDERPNLRLNLTLQEPVLFLGRVFDVLVERAFQCELTELLEDFDLHFVVVRIHDAQLNQLSDRGALGGV